MKYAIISSLLFTSVIFPTRIFSHHYSIIAHTISDSAHDARSIFAADMDGDGDMDILSSHHNIAWYEYDTSGSFIPHTISISAASSIYAVDLDGDGDMDVVGSSDGSVNWYENDGLQSFETHTICNHYWHREFTSVYAFDVDKDEDIDVVAASSSPNNKIMWYENDGSQYFNHHVISDSVRDARFVSAGDVDGDGYMDVISGHSKISWYEYDGFNSFIDHTISTSGSKSVHAIDVNGDGYMDVVAAKRPGIQWHENDGTQRFTTHIITSNKKYGNFSYAVDLDQDGDTDVLSAGDDNITYHENDGLEGFTKRTIAKARKSGFQSIYTADVDSDGDLDVLSAALTNSKISWYEINYPPVANDTAITTSEDRDYNGLLPAFDSDGDPLTYSIITGPPNGRATVSDNAVGTFFYRPVEDYTGLDSLIFSVTDGVLSDTATILITLTAINDAPLAFVSTVKMDEDIGYDGFVSASDIDNDPLTFNLLTNPSHGTVVIIDSSSGTYTYIPKVDFNGIDSFTFTSSDGMLSDTSKVSIKVTSVNDPPIAHNLTIGTYEDTEYSGSLSGFDVENDKLTYNILTNPSNGTVSINNNTLGTFTYSPAINFNGDDSFTFTTNDSDYSDTATVSIRIIPWSNYGADKLPAVQWGNVPTVLRKIMWVYYNLPNEGN